MLAGQGFEIIASGAFIAQHSMTKEVGAGRPDEEDRKEIRDFAVKVLAKLEKSQKNEVHVPLEFQEKIGQMLGALKAVRNKNEYFL